MKQCGKPRRLKLLNLNHTLYTWPPPRWFKPTDKMFDPPLTGCSQYSMGDVGRCERKYNDIVGCDWIDAVNHVRPAVLLYRAVTPVASSSSAASMMLGLVPHIGARTCVDTCVRLPTYQESFARLRGRARSCPP